VWVVLVQFIFVFLGNSPFYTSKQFKIDKCKTTLNFSIRGFKLALENKFHIPVLNCGMKKVLH